MREIEGSAVTGNLTLTLEEASEGLTIKFVIKRGML